MKMLSSCQSYSSDKKANQISRITRQRVEGINTEFSYPVRPPSPNPKMTHLKICLCHLLSLQAERLPVLAMRLENRLG